MNFASDNWAGATDAVMEAVRRHNGGIAAAYGNDDVTRAVAAQFADIFEREVEVHFVATGTAANALSLAALSRPGGLVFCSADAHVDNDEWGATEFLSGGMKLVALPTMAGRIAVDGFGAALRHYPLGGRFGTPVALTLTHATELGTAYAVEMVRELAGMAHAAGLAVHMDGARFANGLVATNANPAEMTWKAGVDVMSFGGTKNGCLGAEAIVIFSPERVPGELAVLRQRTGHVVSKARFIAAQFEGYFADDGWLTTARHANAMAARLADGLVAKGVGRLAWRPDGNEVFAILPDAAIARAWAAGARLYEWGPECLSEADRPTAGESLVRLVTSFLTGVDEVDGFVGALE